MAGDTKQSTVELYESCIFDQLMGDTLRPGGLELTARIAEVAGISQNHAILDLGCGKGATTVFLAREYNTHVVGIDLSAKIISSCRSKANAVKLAERVSFLIANGENLPFRDSSFDIVISECTFSLLHNKEFAARDIRRILKLGGKLVMTDIILRGMVDKKLQGQINFPCCFTGAWQLKEYIQLFEQVGFQSHYIEERSNELKEVGYQLCMTFGSIEYFLSMLPVGPCQKKSDENPVTSFESLQKFLKLSKPGYALVAMTKI